MAASVKRTAPAAKLNRGITPRRLAEVGEVPNLKAGGMPSVAAARAIPPGAHYRLLLGGCRLRGMREGCWDRDRRKIGSRVSVPAYRARGHGRLAGLAGPYTLFRFRGPVDVAGLMANRAQEAGFDALLGRAKYQRIVRPPTGESTTGPSFHTELPKKRCLDEQFHAHQPRMMLTEDCGGLQRIDDLI